MGLMYGEHEEYCGVCRLVGLVDINNQSIVMTPEMVWVGGVDGGTVVWWQVKWPETGNVESYVFCCYIGYTVF